MKPIEILKQHLQTAVRDAELQRLGPGLSGRVRLSDERESFDIVLHDGSAELAPACGPAVVDVRAESSAWARLLESPPPPSFHAFTALELANDTFSVTGAKEDIARTRPMLERLFELSVHADPPDRKTWPRDMKIVSGRYANIPTPDGACDVYYESSGNNPALPPVVFLHTAGADSRQFHGQLSDPDLAERFRLIAFDLPFHGRSLPPLLWDGGPYRLGRERYLDWCASFIETVLAEKVILAGCSMGAAISLTLAAERQDLVAGVVAIEPPFRARGRRNPCQHHVAVHSALHNASFVRGLMSPFSPPEYRRRASWIYSQGAPGIYPGDLAFYSEEFDGEDVAGRIDTNETPVSLLCGSYDYSASPDHGERLKKLMPAAHLQVMPTLGHFPMCEDPDCFRPFLVDALKRVTGPTD